MYNGETEPNFCYLMLRELSMYVYIMHARSVMQQKKEEKKVKRKERRDGKFNWVRQGEM